MIESNTPPLLFTPMTLGNITLRNRVVVSPMCQYASESNGGPNDYHLVHLGQFAMGGAGLVFCEETAVEDRGRKSYHCAGIYHDKHLAQYRRINDFIRQHGAVPAIQLGHGGRKGSGRPPWDGYRQLTPDDALHGEAPWQTISSSEIPTTAKDPAPHSLTLAEIREVIAHWREAALRAAEAGYDVVEIHAAHGYLIHQFLSPLVNQRNDGYGGDLKGRMRFCMEIIEAIRNVWPKEKPVFLRISAVDGSGDAWTLDDTVALALEAKARNIAVFTPSSGGIGGAGTGTLVPRRPGYHVPFSTRVRKDAAIKTIAVGLITEAQQAEQILQNGSADLIALAREFLWNPYWTVHAARELGVANYHDLLPRTYAWWLKRRDEIREVTRSAKHIDIAPPAK
ncbi:MAG TPA: NADH:flavin oxidoreductase/NADH oxidase [Burkholderiales bacterium]|nr:NADH:flavin oxidoreductase/NADH oxidase [Burkholderiales bacterium]